MPVIFGILFASLGGFWTVMAVPMEGGTTLTGHPLWYSHVVQLRKGSEFQCLGVILSSIIVFTSNYCPLMHGSHQDWTVEGLGQPEGTARVDRVDVGKHMNDFKQVTLKMPGLQLPLNNSAIGMHPPNWNSNDELDWMTTPLLVLAYDGKDVKAGAVKIMTDDDEEDDDPAINKTTCKMLYNKAALQNTNMPRNITGDLLCGLKATSKVPYTLFNQSMDVEPGRPCDDSLGSPVMGVDMVMGIMVKAFCGPDLTVAFIQPNKQGLKSDVPEMPDSSASTHIDIYTGTVITITGLSPRTWRTIAPITTGPASSSNPRVINLTAWMVVVVLCFVFPV